jgi:non-homologous end joining protein Ku
MITQDAETGKELERRDLVKGYEFRKGKYLLLNDAELGSVSRMARRGRTCMPCCAKP